MGIVVILDQQESTHRPDRVASAVRELAPRLNRDLFRPFVRTAGDEMQAVVRDALALNRIIEFCLRRAEWWLGVGLGDIDSLGPTARESRGAAFIAARGAVDEAKRRRRWPVAVLGEPRDCAERLQGMSDVLAFVLSRRTDRQWELVDEMRRIGSGSGVAHAQKIRPQTANEQLRAAGLREQEALEDEIAYLASAALRETSL